MWLLRTDNCFKLKQWYHGLKELLNHLLMIMGDRDVIWIVSILFLCPFYFSVKYLLKKETHKKPNKIQIKTQPQLVFYPNFYQMQNLITKVKRNIENNITAVSQIDRRHWNHIQNWLCCWWWLLKSLPVQKNCYSKPVAELRITNTLRPRVKYLTTFLLI